MEIDFCSDEMTTSEENRYIFSFKKVINTERERRAKGNRIILQILISSAHSLHQVFPQEKTKAAEKDLVVSAEEQKTLRHSENLASCTNRP